MIELAEHMVTPDGPSIRDLIGAAPVLYSKTVQLEDEVPAVAEGFATTFLLTRLDGVPLQVEELSDTPLPTEDPDETLDFEHIKHEVESQLFVDNELIGGITADQQFIPHFSDNTYALAGVRQ